MRLVGRILLAAIACGFVLAARGGRATQGLAAVEGRVLSADGTRGVEGATVVALRWTEPDAAHVVVSGPGGRFRLEGLDRRFWRISANSRAAWSAAEHVRLNRDVHRLDLRLERSDAERVEGHVVDLAGDAVAGTRVIVRAGETVLAAIADREGRYELPIPREVRRDHARVFPVAPGLVDPFPEHTLRSSDLQLVPPSTVEGRVVDAFDGAPVAGARVTVSLAERFAKAQSFAVTDSSGGFRVGGLAPGRYTLTARKDARVGIMRARVELVAGVRVRGLEIRVFPGVAVRGRVLAEDRRPVANAEITVREGDGFADVSSLGEVSGTSDSRGMFAIEGLLAGGQSVSALSRGRYGSADVDRCSSAVTLVMRSESLPGLEPTTERPPAAPSIPATASKKQPARAQGGRHRALAHGTVVDPDGRPVGGATVTTATREEPPRIGFSSTDGRFALPITPLDDSRWVRVRIRRSGYLEAEEAVLLGAPAQRIVLTPEAVLKGRLLGPGDAPVRDAIVTVVPNLKVRGLKVVGIDPGWSVVVHDPEGRFEIRDLPEGQVSLDIASPGRFRVRMAATVTAGASDERTIWLRPAVDLRGRLVSLRKNRPLRGADVDARAETLDFLAPALAHGTTDSNGAFTLSCVAPGELVELGASSPRDEGDVHSFYREDELWVRGIPADARGVVDLGQLRYAPESPLESPAGVDAWLERGDGHLRMRRLTTPHFGSIESGDEIVEIDGMDAASLGQHAIEQLFAGAAGSTIVVKVRSGTSGVSRTVTLVRAPSSRISWGSPARALDPGTFVPGPTEP